MSDLPCCCMCPLWRAWATVPAGKHTARCIFHRQVLRIRTHTAVTPRSARFNLVTCRNGLSSQRRSPWLCAEVACNLKSIDNLGHRFGNLDAEERASWLRSSVFSATVLELRGTWQVHHAGCLPRCNLLGCAMIDNQYKGNGTTNDHHSDPTTKQKNMAPQKCALLENQKKRGKYAPPTTRNSDATAT